MTKPYDDKQPSMTEKTTPDWGANAMEALDRQERSQRRYALLQAAATIFAEQIPSGYTGRETMAYLDAVDRAEQLLAEIEQREK